MVNHYFHNYDATNEQNLVDDLIIESIQIAGMMVHYIPKTLNNLDKIFGQDSLMSFDKTYPIEAYFENVNGFEGDKNFLSKFGLEIRKQANFVISRTRFNQAVKFEGGFNIAPALTSTNEVRPMEGDLLYVPLFKDLWEIKFVDHESTFYQLGKSYIWRLNVEKYTYSAEKFDTGVPEIDRVNDTFDDFTKKMNDFIDDSDNLEKEKSTVINDFNPEHPFGKI